MTQTSRSKKSGPFIKKFVQEMLDDSISTPSVIWQALYESIGKTPCGQRRLLDGPFSEYLKHTDEECIAWVMKIYLNAIIRERRIATYSSDHASPRGYKISVGTSTIDELENIWEKQMGRSEPIKDLLQFASTMTSLLEMSIHLEWAGYSGFRTFDRKWRQLLDWNDGDCMNINAISVIEYFVAVFGWPSGCDSHTRQIQDYMPVPLRKSVYKDVLDVYTNRLDHETYGTSARRKMVEILSNLVLRDYEMELEFKEIFKRSK